MRLSRACAAALLVPALAAAAALASAVPCSDPRSLDCVSSHSEQQLLPRDGDHGHGGHNHRVQPIVELNETEVTMYHDPTPLSYYWIDLADSPSGEKRYPGFMALHALFMSLAFFGALPIGALRPGSRGPLPR